MQKMRKCTNNSMGDVNFKEHVCRKVGSGASEESNEINFGKDNKRLLWATLCDV